MYMISCKISNVESSNSYVLKNVYLKISGIGYYQWRSSCSCPLNQLALLKPSSQNSKFSGLLRRQVAQSVERRTLEAEVWGSKPMLSTWWWGRIPPNQPYPKGAAPWPPHYSLSGDPQFPGEGLT